MVGGDQGGGGDLTGFVTQHIHSNVALKAEEYSFRSSIIALLKQTSTQAKQIQTRHKSVVWGPKQVEFKKGGLVLAADMLYIGM